MKREAALVGFRQRPRWFLAVVMLLLAQGYLTVQTFGGIDGLFDRQPIVTGQHPLHLYHGWLGAQRWLDCGTSCCYDPAFQAGYPKTPIFDDGSRPAELFLFFAGGAFSPLAYKLGIAICCLFAPLAFIIMARGIGLSPASACLSGLLGVSLWWSSPVRELVMLGDFDLLLGGFCVLIYITWLIRFDRWPGLDSWIVLTITGCLGWYTSPLLWAAFLPLVMLFYIWCGARQGVGWHLSLIAATITGIAVNAYWLWEWTKFWWIVAQDLRDWPTFFVPIPAFSEISQSFRLQPINASVIVCGLVGLAVCIYRRHHAASVLLGTSIVGLLFIVRLGRVWEPLGAMGSEKLLVLAGWFAVCPCAAMISQVIKICLLRSKHPVRVGVFGMVFVTGVIAALGPLDEQLTTRPRVEPFEVGLSRERDVMVQSMIAHTTRDARILWQDRSHGSTTSRWTALLPHFTDRSYLGGLDPEASVEHMFARLIDDELAGRKLDQWTDAELTRFCERYNVGWVMCWSPKAVKRFRAFTHTSESRLIQLEGEGVLYTIKREPSFVLKGHARWVEADGHRIALADVVPEDGVVVLSLHYQAGMMVAPSYARMERELDPYDPIPLIRLKLPGPVARLTITWENP